MNKSSKKKKKIHQSIFFFKNSRFPNFSKKKNQNFQILQKIQDFQIFFLKINQKFQFHEENSRFPNFSKKKKNHQSKFSIP